MFLSTLGHALAGEGPAFQLPGELSETNQGPLPVETSLGSCDPLSDALKAQKEGTKGCQQ
jgi:hypothetical protein